MKYRYLGNTGLLVSEVGLGTNQFGGRVSLQETKNIIDAAFDAGINFIDTADRYQDGKSEAFIGDAIKHKRDKFILATKFGLKVGEGPNDVGASRYHIIESVHQSLKRLKTDYIDLYQIHIWDPNTPIDETLSTLDTLIKTGKVRYIGASNFDAWQLIYANSVANKNNWHSFISIQPHYHLLERSIENELIPAAEFFNIGVIPYFPLAGGFLTGKYKKGELPPKNSRGENNTYVQSYFSDKNFQTLDDLHSFARQNNHKLNELAISWLLSKPIISTDIVGATKTEHVLSNTNASNWVLSSSDLAQINLILNKK